MKTQLKKTLSNKKTPLIFALLCFLSGIVCCLFGELTLPLPIAFLAVLYLFDNSKKHSLSIVSSVLIVAINIVGLLLGINLSAFGPASVVLAFSIFYSFTKKQQKSDAAFVMTIVCAAFSLISYILIAMRVQGVYTFDAVIEFYTTIASMLRENFVSLMLEAYTIAGISVTPEALVQLFDAQLNMVISYLLIGAFFVIGVSFKLFGLIVGRCVEDKGEISSWRFFTTNVYAYFYIILMIVCMFIPALDGIIPVVVINLYNLFLVVYAYVGFNFAFAMLTKKFNPFVSFIILIGAILVLASVAIQLLSALGVMFTIRKNNEAKLLNQ